MVSMDEKIFASEVCKTLSRCVPQVFTRLDAIFFSKGACKTYFHSQSNSIQSGTVSDSHHFGVEEFSKTFPDQRVYFSPS